jgi:hypothetical protein
VPSNSDGQVTLLPAQLGRLAKLYSEGGAVRISQKGSTITAFNGTDGVTLNSAGHKITHNPDQETFPLAEA